MSQKPAIFFPVDAADNPVGGTNILIRIAQWLKDAGHDVTILHNEPRFAYVFWSHDVALGYDPKLKNMMRGRKAEWARPKLKRRLLPFVYGGAPNPVCEPKAGDIVVLPEYRYPELAALYPECRRLVAIQDVFGFYRGFLRDPGGAALSQAEAVFATSKACLDAAKAVYDGTVREITLPIDLPGLDFTAEKSRQIAYMPRKRATEAAAVAQALALAPETADYEIIPIDGRPPQEVARILREARIFLSYSKEEGFGLPPAEAMRAGCITIGFTGVGGEEFFTPETGIVVPDSDIVGIINATRAVAAEYDRDPARLDALRRHAATFVSERYTVAAFEASAQAFWDPIAR
ncbi:MAG: glycosyltransferase [Pseudomonadota bacterium]